MKNLKHALAFSLFAAASFLSCTKDYNCNCRESTGREDIVAIHTRYKADAEKACAERIHADTLFVKCEIE